MKCKNCNKKMIKIVEYPIGVWYNEEEENCLHKWLIYKCIKCKRLCFRDSQKLPVSKNPIYLEDAWYVKEEEKNNENKNK